jgi:CheY-like chemotaxis protein
MKGIKKAAIVSGQPHDLLLLDYSMPGLNGNEVAKLIRKDKSGLSSLSIVMMGTMKQKQLVTASVQGYLLKPIKRNHLWNAVSALCNTNKAKTAQQNKSGERQQLHVLVAEDNIMNQRILKSIVERMGHKCAVTSNGLEAIAEWERQPYDVIFMDCRMPLLDGFEATLRIREKEAAKPIKIGVGSSSSTMIQHIPIIALTADVMHGTRESCLKVGMDDYLSKPVKKVAIEEILQALVDKKRNLASSGQQSCNSDEFDPMHHKPTILLVEDNEVNIKIGSTILRRHGFDVHVARGGQESVELVQANPRQYQLILMDMHMPGMDGQTATEHIREFEEQNGLSPVPIIALTGDTTEGFRGMCLAAGCSEYMPKPIDYPLLVQLCKNLIRCPEAE